MAKLNSGTRIFGTATVDSTLVVGNTASSNSTSNSTGSLVVTGGVGITGNVYANAMYDSNTRIITVAQNAYGVANNALPNTGALITVNTSSQLYVSNTTASRSNITGSLIVSGGVGIAGNLYSGNIVLAAANSITFGDATIQTTAGSSVANTIYLTGVNTAQNARMVIIENTNLSQNVRLDYSNTAITSNQIYSQAAFAKANNAVANLGPVITVSSAGYLYVSNTFVSTSNVTGALVVSGGVGITGNVNASGAKFVSTVAPTYDTVSISNSGFPVTTAGVNGMSIAYFGGAAAVEASAARVDLTPGTTAGGIWNAYRAVVTTDATTGVGLNVLKVDTIASPGTGSSNVIYVGTGYDSIINYNGTSIIGGTGNITMIAGTTTVPPIQFGTNSVVTTVPLPNAFESDGSSLYYTTQSLSANNGRQIIKAAQVVSIQTPIGVASAGQYFAGSRPQLTANHIYQFNYFLTFKKVTAGTVTFSFSNSNTVNFIPLHAQIVITGQPGIAASNTIMGVYANAATTTTSSAIQLNANGGYSAFINGVVTVAGDTRLQLLVTDSAGTISANTGSVFTLTDLGTTNNGNLA